MVTIFAVVCLLFSSLSQAGDRPSFQWSELPELPPALGQQKQIGLAGSFSGVHNGALIVAGGANFPIRPSWDGGKKVWWDDILSP